MVNKNRFILLISIIFSVMFIVNAYSNEEIILLPKKIEKVHLGMEYKIFKELFPKSRNMLATGADGRVLVGDYFQDDNIWDSVGYDFIDDYLSSFSLMRGVTKLDNMNEVLQDVLSKTIEQYGADFSKRIVKGTGEMEMQPLFFWNEKDFNVYLSYIPDNQIAKGKRPGISLTYAISSRKINELFEIPAQQKIEESLFEAIVGNNIEKLYIHKRQN